MKETKEPKAVVPREDAATPMLSFETLEKIADCVVKSKLFGVRSKEEAMALMLLAQAEGTHPMNAVKEYYIVSGRPALRADAMLARFQKAGGRVKWITLSDTKAKATFYHPAGGEVTIEWDIERAKRAGLVKEGSAWMKYPRAMLRARVISEGIRTVYPAVIVGIYTPEEVQDMAEEAEREVIEAEVQEEEETAGATVDTQEEQKATDKQIGFIRQLMETKGFKDEDWPYITKEVLGEEKSMEALTSSEASRVIDFLKEVKRVNLTDSQKNVLRHRLENLKLPEKVIEKIVESINHEDFVTLSRAIQNEDRETFIEILRKYGINVRTRKEKAEPTAKENEEAGPEKPEEGVGEDDMARIPF